MTAGDDGAIAATAAIHPTAVVDRGASVGAGTRIWHFCHVMAGARVGAHCVLGQGVYVGARAVVGDGCRIQNQVSIYDAVELETDVFVGPSAVFTNVTRPRAFISRKADFRTTRVARGATIGANATIVCGHSLGAYCLIGAGAVVTGDVAPHALMMGVPARRMGWVCRCGETLAFSASRARCPACGTSFHLVTNASGGESVALDDDALPPL